MTDDIIIPLDDAGRQDLQKLVRRAGERYAASLGEPYEPARRGGYIHITEWDAWDEANREWRERRRLGLAPLPGAQMKTPKRRGRPVEPIERDAQR